MGLLLILIGAIGGLVCLIGGLFFWPLLLGAGLGFFMVVWGMQIMARANKEKTLSPNLGGGGKVVISERHGRFIVSTFGKNSTGAEVGQYASHKEAKNEASRLALLHNLDFVDETLSSAPQS